jgi:hypothetical protein
VPDMTLEEMQQAKLASCPVCSELNSYVDVGFNDWTHCKACKTAMVLVKIDGIIFFLRNGWT